MDIITKDQAVAIVGKAAIDTILSMDVDFTGRLTDGTVDIGCTEFAASLDAVNNDGDLVTVTMFLLIDSDNLIDCDDLSNLNWDSAIANARFRIF